MKNKILKVTATSLCLLMISANSFAENDFNPFKEATELLKTVKNEGQRKALNELYVCMYTKTFKSYLLTPVYEQMIDGVEATKTSSEAARTEIDRVLKKDRKTFSKLVFGKTGNSEAAINACNLENSDSYDKMTVRRIISFGSAAGHILYKNSKIQD